MVLLRATLEANKIMYTLRQLYETPRVDCKTTKRLDGPAAKRKPTVWSIFSKTYAGRIKEQRYKS